MKFILKLIFIYIPILVALMFGYEWLTKDSFGLSEINKIMVGNPGITIGKLLTINEKGNWNKSPATSNKIGSFSSDDVNIGYFQDLLDKGFIKINTKKLTKKSKIFITKSGKVEFKDALVEVKKEEEEAKKAKALAKEEAKKAKALAKEKASYFPVPQKELIKIIMDSALEYSKQETQIRKTQTRKKRGAKIKELIGKRGTGIKNWKGAVRSIKTDQEGNVDLVSIEHDDEKLKWVFGGLPDGFDGIRFTQRDDIKSSNPLVEKIADLQSGDLVLFSGKFFAGKRHLDYLSELSMTEGGSMEEPVFIVNFTNIKKL